MKKNVKKAVTVKKRPSAEEAFEKALAQAAPPKVVSSPDENHELSKKVIGIGMIVVFIIIVLSVSTIYIMKPSLYKDNPYEKLDAMDAQSTPPIDPESLPETSQVYSDPLITFSYPSDWKASKNANAEALTPFESQVTLSPTGIAASESGIITIMIDSANQTTLQDAMEKECEKIDCAKAVSVTQEGFSGQRLNNVPGTTRSDVIWLENNGILYRISLTKDADGTTEHGVVFNNFLKSFTFTPKPKIN